jgi:predicted phage terminase large subunit-like protein
MEEPSNPNKVKLIDAVAQADDARMALLRDKCTTDLFLFNKYILEADKGDDAFVPLGDIHKKMCNFVSDDRNKKKLLLIPRNHLKTKLISVGYSLFRIYNDPKIRILVYSATWQMAVDIVSQIQGQMVRNERLVSLFGNLQEDSKEWSAARLRLSVNDKREPTVTAAGIDNNLVGGHYDLIIFDDVQNRDNVGTAEQINKVRQRYNDSLDLLEPGGQIIVIGTRWHDADLYGWILDPSNAVGTTYDNMVMRAFTGNIETGEDFVPLWPGKFSLKEFQDRLASEGWSHFSAQYLNDPVPEADAIFKRDQFQYYEPEDLRGKLLTRFMTIDPAISQQRHADFTSMVVVGVDEQNYIWILDILREKILPSEIISRIFEMKEKWNLSDIALETIAYQKTLAYTLREQMRVRKKYFHITELNPQNRSKDERIKGLQPLYENGKIVHNKYLTNNYFLEDELTRYPYAKHDDCIDALSYMLDIIYPARQKVTTPGRRRYLYG